MNEIKYFSEDLDIQNKTVILRLDLNVPLNNKEIQDKNRVRDYKYRIYSTYSSLLNHLKASRIVMISLLIVDSFLP